MVKCNACGGTYEPMLPDGYEYFHACPPLAPAELRAAIAADTIRLPRADRARLDAAIAADRAQPLPAGEPSREFQVLASLNVDRANKRDENVIASDPDAKDRRRRIKAEGAGVTPVAG